MVQVSQTRFVMSLLVALGITVGSLYAFGFRNMRFFLVPSTSMEPTLYPSDYLVTLNAPTYRRGDIVVLRDPKDPDSYLVKRIVGIPGDTIAIAAGALFINGKYASEPYIQEPMQAEMGPVKVGEGEYFVLGDNRNQSEDSATWGRGVPAADIVGKVRFIYNPLSRMGPVASYPLANLDEL